MPAQKGTLNLVGQAGFLVVAVPVSAFKGVDDDGDGALSTQELNTHRARIADQVNAGVVLEGPAGVAPLALVMLDIAPPDDQPQTLSKQLVVLGRFDLGSDQAMRLRFTLFGTGDDEKQHDFTITRQKESQWLRYTPDRTTHQVLPGGLRVLGDYLLLGAVHILTGWDHLLFLLVVLAATWRWQVVVALLTCFTLGHALTLVACVWGNWSAPARIVEPAIAATLVLMAALDGYAHWRSRPIPLPLRLTLVFACALVHGLGLAGALGDITQWPIGSAALASAILGFNLGIELAQLAVALVAGTLVLAAYRTVGPQVLGPLRTGAILVGLSTGAFWWIQRIGQ